MQLQEIRQLTVGIERRSERHALGLFTREAMEGAFVGARLSVEQRRGSPRHCGVYIGRATVPQRLRTFH